MFYSLSARFEQLCTAEKLCLFKFLLLFHFVIIFYSLSSCPLLARRLFLIVLHNDVKTAWEKRDFWRGIGTENTFKIAIIKSYHFPICIFIPSTNLFTKNDVIYQYKRTINDKTIEASLQNLYQYDWDTIKTHQDANEAYNNFISTFCTIYDTFFPINKMKIKTKDLESTWITKRTKKIS